MSWQRIELNMIPDTKVLPVVHASQFDSNRSISFQMFTGEDEWIIPEGLTIELHCRKVDDNIVTLAPLSVDGSVITFITTEQLTACSGQNKCELSFIGADDHVIGSLNFILDVEPDPLKGGLTSASSIYDLTQQIEDITQEVIGDDYYNKTETDALLADKADVSDLPDMSLYYTKSQSDTLLNAKADKTDTYTKAQVDSALAAKANSADLATVATTGNYDDLINKPSIPAAQVQSDYAQENNTQVDYIKNKPNIAGMIASAIDNILPVVSDSGAIATINVGLERALKTITVVPLATQVVRCGVNFTTANDTTTSEAGYIVGAGFPEYVNTDETVLPSGTYTVSFITANATYPCAAQIVFYDSNGTSVGTDVISINLAGRVSISITANANVNRWQIFCNSPTGGAFSDFQIEAGSTAHDYADYNGNVYPVTDIANITTLNGINNIYADAGDVSVSAYDSIQHYIDTRI